MITGDQILISGLEVVSGDRSRFEEDKHNLFRYLQGPHKKRQFSSNKELELLLPTRKVQANLRI